MTSSVYSDGYKNAAFTIWYSRGRLPVTNLQMAMAEELKQYTLDPPSISTLNVWIKEWKEKAEQIDLEAAIQIRDKMIETRIQMLERHADVGKQLQMIAFNYIDTHKDELTINSAAKILVEGWKMEKESVDLPNLLKSYRDKSDDQLLSELKQLVEGDVSNLVDDEDEIDDEDILNLDDND